MTWTAAQEIFTMIHDHDDPGFWPGFVAAISGIVQGLLATAVALAGMVYVLGQLALSTSTPTPQAVAAATPTKITPPLPTAREVQPAPVFSTQPAQTRRQPSAPSRSAVAQPALVATLEFVDNAVLMPRSAQDDLFAAVKRAHQGNGIRWRIEIATDKQDIGRHRAAFLRTVAVRNVLLNAGVNAVDIDTGMVDRNPGASASTPMDQSDRVRVFALDVSGKSLTR